MHELSGYEVNKRIAILIARYFPFVVLSLAAAYVVSAAGGYATSYLAGLFVDALGHPAASPWPRLIELIALYAAASIFVSVAGALSNYLQFRLRFRSQQVVWNSLYESTARLDLGQIEDPAIKDLSQKIHDNAFEIFNYILRITWIFWSLASLAIGGVILGSFAWWVPIAIVACSYPVYLVQRSSGIRAWGISGLTAEDQRKYSSYANHFADPISFAQLKLGSAAGFFLQQLDGLQHNTFSLLEKNQRAALTKTAALDVLLWIPYALILAFFLHEVIAGIISAGNFIFVLGSVFGVASAAGNLLTQIGDQIGSFGYVRDYFSFLSLSPALPRHEIPLVRPQTTPRIEFQNVSFAYPGASSATLRDVSFTIEPGQKVALIGINGAGKSTLVKLLARFYDPTEGRILIDGVDLRDIDLESWHAQLGILFQDFARYRFEAQESIRIGRHEKRAEEAIVGAAKRSGADSFISDWKEGYRSQLGRGFRGGVEPSVGQWQKIAIARMFYREPLLYILDEPTASIDAQAESEIFREFDALPSTTSVLMISHRFSTVRNADKILVLENGTLSETGSHEELMTNAQTYSHLFKLQAKGYEL